MKTTAFCHNLIWTLICLGVATNAASTTTTLHNNVALPLVGLGVGNLAPSSLTRQIPVAVSDYGYQLIDTAHASQNEADIRQSLSDAVSRNGTAASLRRSPSPSAENYENQEVHVVSKIWYTHLGYARTVISVKESWDSLKMIDETLTSTPALHMLLHWPRCRYDIPWMDCEREEADLPNSVKRAGPAPHLDPDNAFVESWRALEDLYEASSSSSSSDVSLASIGVSNFDLDDLKRLEQSARIMPHIIQLNVWTVVFDPYLMEYCEQHQIHVQVYNVMNGIVGLRDEAPNAFESLWSVAHSLREEEQRTSDKNITPAQVVMAWLTQQGISVIPRTSDPERLESNAPATIAAIPELSEEHQDKVVMAVRALLTGRDLDQPTARFFNDHPSDVLHLFWLHADTKEEVPVQLDLPPGEHFDTQTFPGHVFVAYNGDRVQRREFTISASYGEEQEWVIDEL